jgi:hypothetical protein
LPVSAGRRVNANIFQELLRQRVVHRTQKTYPDGKYIKSLADSAPPYPARTTQKLLVEFWSGRLDAIFDRLELTGLCYLATFACKSPVRWKEEGEVLPSYTLTPVLPICLPLPVLGPAGEVSRVQYGQPAGPLATSPPTPVVVLTVSCNLPAPAGMNTAAGGRRRRRRRCGHAATVASEDPAQSSSPVVAAGGASPLPAPSPLPHAQPQLSSPEV